jgi:PAS domain S-box-containing protein
MTAAYDPVLVVLSYLIAVLASYVALNLASRVSVSQGRVALYWLFGGAAAMGTGIWSMHFIGMLAFHLPIPISYDIPMTLLSMFIAAVASGFALFTVNRDTLAPYRLLASGTVMGIGIAAMHYTGMAAMRMFPPIRYDPQLFALSIAIAIVASIAALWIAFHLRSATAIHVAWKRSGAALIMGVAIVGMHFTGMAAAHFDADSICLGGPQQISTAWLAATIACCTVLLLTGTMLIRGGGRMMLTPVGGPVSIRLKLSASFLAVALLVVSFVVIMLWMQMEAAEYAAIFEADHMATTIAAEIGGNDTGDPQFAQRQITKLLGHDVRDVFVVDANKRVIADADPTEIGLLFSNDPDNAIGSTLADGRTHTFTEVHESPRSVARQVAVPIYRDPANRRSSIVGALILEYTPLYNAMMTEARAVFYFLAAVGVAFVFLIAAFGIRVASAISLPLAELKRGVVALSAGNYKARVKVASKDEIGALAVAFNSMAEDLCYGHAKLVEHQCELENRVATRTAEWQRAEEAQRQTAAELRLITEHVPVALCYVDRELRYRYHNNRYAKLVGVAADQIDGRGVSEVWGAQIYDSVKPWIDQALAGREVAFEHQHRPKGGEAQQSYTTLVPRLENDGSVVGYYAMIQNVTERKRAEEAQWWTNDELIQVNLQLREAQNQLLQAEKMASIGQLASGVAHEINNPIGYVCSNFGTLDRYLSDIFVLLERYRQAAEAIADKTLRADLRSAWQTADIDFVKVDVLALLAESKEGITRVKQIVQDLKNFSRAAGDEDWQWADLHQGIDSTLNIVWNELKYKTEICKEYGELPQVQCRPSQLNQVFLNMLVNGADAIKQRGTITIRSGADSDSVWIEFADTGEGINPEHVSRIFDPFFTTKAVGKGTGLGLSVAYGIVKAHNGRIDVRSEVGNGTSFRVWLPIRQPGLDKPAAPPRDRDRRVPATTPGVLEPAVAGSVS